MDSPFVPFPSMTLNFLRGCWSISLGNKELIILSLRLLEHGPGFERAYVLSLRLLDHKTGCKRAYTRFWRLLEHGPG